MNASDSSASSDNNKHTNINIGNTASCLKNQSDDPKPGSNKHDYFIPVIMVIVLGIIIVATFFDKEPSMLAANVMPQDHNNGLTSNVTDEFYASAGSDQQAAIATDGSTVSAPVSARDDISTAAAVSGTAASSTWRKTISANDQTSYSVRQEIDPYPYAPPSPYSMIEARPHPFNEMMHARRKAYEQAVQAHNERMQKIHAYRAAVLNRSQRDLAFISNQGPR